MAEISYTVVHSGHRYTLIKWEGVTHADTCQPVALPDFTDCTIQAYGDTFADTLECHGGLDPDDSTAVTPLSDPSGTEIAIDSSAPIASILQNCFFYVPTWAAGASGSEIDIFILANRSRA